MVPAAGEYTTVGRESFPGWLWRVDGCFKLLGAPFGTVEHCEALTRKCVEKAEALLDALRKYDDVRGGVLLLCGRGSWCKLVYSARTVPPALHRAALSAYEGLLKQELEHLNQVNIPERSWDPAQLRIANGGLGIRGPVWQAGAAYLASVTETRHLCKRINPGFEDTDTAEGLCSSQKPLRK